VADTYSADGDVAADADGSRNVMETPALRIAATTKLARRAAGKWTAGNMTVI
jgi:hypothetical protein